MLSTASLNETIENNGGYLGKRSLYQGGQAVSMKSGMDHTWFAVGYSMVMPVESEEPGTDTGVVPPSWMVKLREIQLHCHHPSLILCHEGRSRDPMHYPIG